LRGRVTGCALILEMVSVFLLYHSSGLYYDCGIIRFSRVILQPEYSVDTGNECVSYPHLDGEVH